MRVHHAVLATALMIPSAAHAQRYALGMFHYNVQYVAGGLVKYPAYAGELRPDEVEDLIITESLTPILEMYAAHPDWGVDIELQGYLLDVLAARHPEVLDLMRDLALAGRVEIVSFHYSDQLFIAYPAQDWERSQALTQATFEAHGIPLGTSVFCQEGQAGAGMADRMVERGYEVMVWPKNLWTGQHGDFVPAALYTFGDALLVVGALGVDSGEGESQVEVTWTFFDDGELLATNDFNPYFPGLFIHDPEAVAEYEQRLLDLEADGWSIVSVADYAAAVSEVAKIDAAPPLMDGTWQPGSTRAVARWMGHRGLWDYRGDPADRDNHVRTLGSLAHRELTAAETAATVAGIDARDQLDAAWRMLAMGQVTDASGINPYRGEVEYGLAHLADALRIARDVIELAKAGEASVIIDPQGSTMVPGDTAPFGPGRAAAPLFDVVLAAEDPGRSTDVAWEQLEPGHHRVTLTWGPGPEGGAATVSATFPGEASDTLVTTLALADDAPVVYRRSDFTLPEGEFHLALPLGLISLGPATFLIKDTARVHLAARIVPDGPDVQFVDETLAPAEGTVWVFHVYEGDADQAVALARRINAEREVVR